MLQVRYPDRDVRMPDERRQQLGTPMQSSELSDHRRPQLGRVLGREVRQPAVLGVLPDHLVGVGLGGLALELLSHLLMMLIMVCAAAIRTALELLLFPQRLSFLAKLRLQLHLE